MIVVNDSNVLWQYWNRRAADIDNAGSRSGTFAASTAVIATAPLDAPFAAAPDDDDDDDNDDDDDIDDIDIDVVERRPVSRVATPVERAEGYCNHRRGSLSTHPTPCTERVADTTGLGQNHAPPRARIRRARRWLPLPIPDPFDPPPTENPQRAPSSSEPSTLSLPLDDDDDDDDEEDDEEDDEDDEEVPPLTPTPPTPPTPSSLPSPIPNKSSSSPSASSP